MKLQQLIDSLHEGIKVNILGEEYTSTGCVDYVTYGHPNIMHTKVYFNDKYVMVISVKDDFCCFGQDVGTISEGDGFSEKFSYKGINYDIQSNDYQMVKCVRYGNPVDLEGEVKFWDYQGDDNKTIISLATISKTGDRSDVIATVLTASDYFIVY